MAGAMINVINIFMYQFSINILIIPNRVVLKKFNSDFFFLGLKELP